MKIYTESLFGMMSSDPARLRDNIRERIQELRFDSLTEEQKASIELLFFGHPEAASYSWKAKINLLAESFCGDVSLAEEFVDYCVGTEYFFESAQLINTTEHYYGHLRVYSNGVWRDSYSQYDEFVSEFLKQSCAEDMDNGYGGEIMRTFVNIFCSKKSILSTFSKFTFLLAHRKNIDTSIIVKVSSNVI